MNYNCTLIPDGSSDAMLIPAIRWLLIDAYPHAAFNFEVANITRFTNRRPTLEQKICLALEFFPCDLLFIHRDAEKQPPEDRKAEIQSAIESAECQVSPHISVIPVRMSEAWLLIDEASIRTAAGNPNGTVNLSLPSLKELEKIPDPKSVLLGLLEEATELSKRRRKKFNAHRAIHHLAEIIPDYSRLRTLTAFSALEEEIIRFNL